MEVADTQSRLAPRTRFIAIGHAGAQLIRHLPERVPELLYTALDTDRASLAEARIADAHLLAERLTGGAGTGGNTELALECAEEERTFLVDLIDSCDVVVIVAGLGGGTGGTIGAWLASVAREAGCIVIAALVRPMEAEGGHRRQSADASLAEFRESAHAVCMFPLDVLREEGDEHLPLKTLFVRSGIEVSRSIGSLAVLLRTGWLLPLSLQDIIQVMNRADGYCRLVAVSAEGDNRISETVEALLTHPLLERGTLLTQSGGLVIGILASDDLSVKEVEGIMRDIRHVLRTDAEVKIGVGLDSRFGGRLGLVVLVAERWSTRPLTLEKAFAGEEVDEEADPSEDSTGTALVQGEIQLDAGDQLRGRFKNVEPTIVEGEDLDTPTFIRLGIPLSKKGKRK